MTSSIGILRRCHHVTIWRRWRWWVVDDTELSLIERIVCMYIQTPRIVCGRSRARDSNVRALLIRYQSYSCMDYPSSWINYRIMTRLSRSTSWSLCRGAREIEHVTFMESCAGWRGPDVITFSHEFSHRLDTAYWVSWCRVSHKFRRNF